MATRMQQRRGTAAQWTGSNPILNAAEIGYETDTNKFKIGDGTNHWADLTYFVDGAAISNIVDGAPALLDTLNELAAAIGDDPSFFTTVATNLSNHEADTTNIHGIADTSALATKTYADTAVSTHNSDTTSVHGISDTAELATKTFAAELLTNATKSNITITGNKDGLTITAENGVADSTTDNLTEGSTNKYFTDERAQDAVGNNVGTGLSYDDNSGVISVNTTTIQARVANVSDTEIGYLDGVTSAIQTQLDSKAALSGATFTGEITTTSTSASTSTSTGSIVAGGGLGVAGSAYVGGNLTISGNFTVSGTTTTVSSTSLSVADPMIYMGADNSGNLVDLGIVSSFNDGTYQHSGLVRDASDGKWKLFKGVTDEPTTTVNFAQGSLDALAVGALEATSLTIGSVSNTEIGYLDGVTSAIQTQLDAKLASATAASTYAPIASPTFTGTVTLPSGTVTSGMILDGTIVNADINASAAISVSKLATGTEGYLLTVVSGVPTWATAPATGPTAVEIVMGVFA